MIKLSPRMRMAADMVRPGSIVCDVGTDHAYLPSFLVQSGVCPSALACDIGEGPLLNAKKSVCSLGLEDKIALRLSDGLDEISPSEADDFVFCGMGGTLIAALLKRAPWLKDPAKRIIAQPMTHGEDVRHFLAENGFEIEFENACKDAGHDYIAFRAVYTGVNRPAQDYLDYCGKLPVKENAAARRQLKSSLDRLKKHRTGIDGRADADELKKLDEIIERLTEVIKDAEG